MLGVRRAFHGGNRSQAGGDPPEVVVELDTGRIHLSPEEIDGGAPARNAAD
jgi:hypothetical protein